MELFLAISSFSEKVSLSVPCHILCPISPQSNVPIPKNVLFETTLQYFFIIYPSMVLLVDNLRFFISVEVCDNCYFPIGSYLTAIEDSNDINIMDSNYNQLISKIQLLQYFSLGKEYIFLIIQSIRCP